MPGGKGASAKAKRLRRLRDAGANMSFAQRAGPTSAGIWGGTVTGLTEAKLLGLRVSSLKAGGRLPKGASLGLRLQCSRSARKDPMRIHEGQVVRRWAEAVWEGHPNAAILTKSLEGARKRLARANSKWAVASDPVVVFLITLGRLGWTATSHAELVTDLGQKVSLLHLAPGMVQQLAVQAVSRADRQALWRQNGNWPNSS